MGIMKTKNLMTFVLGIMFLFSGILFAEEVVKTKTEAALPQPASVQVAVKTDSPKIEKTDVVVSTASATSQTLKTETTATVPTQINVNVSVAAPNTEQIAENVSRRELPDALKTKNTVVSEKITPLPTILPELETTTTEEDNESLYLAFFIMAKRGAIPALKMFFDKNLEVNRKNKIGMTVLLEAVKANQEKTVKFLLKSGADPKVVTKNGVNCLRFAVENNNIKLVKLFLKKDVNVGTKDALGQTPLKLSIEKNYYKITKLLLKNMKAFDVDVQDKNGKSLLMAAVENNDVSLVNDLMKKNANIWLIDNKSEDALSIAEKHSNKKLIKILKKSMEKDRKDNPTVDQWVRKPGSKLSTR